MKIGDGLIQVKDRAAQHAYALTVVEQPKRCVMSSTCRIVLIDPQDVYREGVRCLLSEEPGLCVVDVGRSWTGSSSEIQNARPDVILIDVSSDGTAATSIGNVCKELPEVPIIAMANVPNKDDLIAAINAGASGYISKRGDTKLIVDAVHAVSHGQIYFDPNVAAEALMVDQNNSSNTQYWLTPRERDVLRLLADAHSNKEIAGILDLRTTTVQYDVKRICEKLNVRNRIEAALRAEDALLQ